MAAPAVPQAVIQAEWLLVCLGDIADFAKLCMQSNNLDYFREKIFWRTFVKCLEPTDFTGKWEDLSNAASEEFMKRVVRQCRAIGNTNPNSWGPVQGNSQVVVVAKRGMILFRHSKASTKNWLLRHFLLLLHAMKGLFKCLSALIASCLLLCSYIVRGRYFAVASIRCCS
jgi:hypothetical protein